MNDKVASKDLYRILRNGCGGAMKTLGFGKLAGTSLGWTRREGDEHLSVWFQVDRNGWEDGFGSRFTYEFQRGRDAATGTGRFDRRRRFFQLIDADRREQVRKCNDVILTGLPRFAANPNLAAVLKGMHPSMLEMWTNSYAPSTGPYPAGLDVWLHYFKPTDVERWATWIADSLAPQLAAFLDEVPAMPASPA
jgi:hypothetical protein